MAGESHATAIYFQLGSVRSASYTDSQGISPGQATVRCLPTAQFQPGQQGTLVITDGFRSLVLPDCKVADVQAETTSAGKELTLRIYDRRWKWGEYGSISGVYNQLDPHGKLILWTVRSPIQLAVLCLDAMGESGYTIDLPDGIDGPVTPPNTIPDFLNPGQNLPVTVTNPPINWLGEPPFQALQRLCDLYGRRIVLNVVTNRIAIVQPGIGADLPNGALTSVSPGIKLPSKPDIVAAVGSPIKYQGRFIVQAVGEEWDGTLKPVEALSYAPIVGAKKEVVEETVLNAATIPAGMNVTWTLTIGDGISSTDYGFTTIGPFSETPIAAGLAAQINATCTVATATSVGAVITITGVTSGVSFSVDYNTAFPASLPNSAPSPTFKEVFKQAASNGKPSWKFSPPPLFPGVRLTRRLTVEEARQKAQKSVWKYYQLINLGFNKTGSPGPIIVPGYGPITRRQQVELLPTKAKQVVPEDADLTFKTRDGLTLINNYYTGYSRDMPAEVFGSVSRWLQDATYTVKKSFVTAPTDKVHVSFEIDPVYQVIIFSSPVYTIDDTNFSANMVQIGQAVAGGLQGFITTRFSLGGGIVEPYLVLETGCHVRDPDNNQFICFVSAGQTPGAPLGTGALLSVHDDIHYEAIGAYDQANNLIGVDTGMNDDPISRAKYYVQGMQLQYQPSQSLTNTYMGIVPCSLDGAICQATYEFGSGGSSTTISRNTEHHPAVPSLPERRRAEMLIPSRLNQLLNDADPQNVFDAGGRK